MALLLILSAMLNLQYCTVWYRFHCPKCKVLSPSRVPRPCFCVSLGWPAAGKRAPTASLMQGRALCVGLAPLAPAHQTGTDTPRLLLASPREGKNQSTVRATRIGILDCTVNAPQPKD